MPLKARRSWARVYVAIVVVVTVIFLCLSQAPSRPAVHEILANPRIHDLPAITNPQWRHWLTDNKVKVSAVIFYGRRQYVRILDKYLKRNLLSTGGPLEEVLWIVYTQNMDDVNWLDEVLLPSEPNHYRRVTPKDMNVGFGQHYGGLESDRYYLKLDDDIVYVQPGAVDAMLHAKMQNRFFIISANVINHTGLTWVHAAIGAMQAYQQRGFDFVPNKTNQAQSFLDGTPFEKMPRDAYYPCAIQNFTCAATCHYNFLDSLAHNDLEKYDFGSWDFHAFDYRRWSINTIMFKGGDLNNETIMDDDEETISNVLPHAKGRHCGAIGSAIVVHMAYSNQRSEQLEEKTHLLQHYTALAEKLHGPLLPL